MRLEQNENDLKGSFNKIAKNYDEITDTFSHKLAKYVTEKNLFKELPSPSNKLKILDSGGGAGKWSIKLAERGYNVTLSDISDNLLQEAEKKIKDKKLHIRIINCNSEKTPFNNEEFDIIIMCGGVISYTPDYKKLLKECNRILKRNGLLWFDYLNSLGWAIEIQNANISGDLALSDEKLIKMNEWDYPARTFSYYYLQNILNNNGFKIKSKYGLLLLSNSFPLDFRYSKEYDIELLNKYKKIELELSRREDCFGSSWCCSILAQKK